MSKHTKGSIYLDSGSPGAVNRGWHTEVPTTPALFTQLAGEEGQRDHQTSHSTQGPQVTNVYVIIKVTGYKTYTNVIFKLYHPHTMYLAITPVHHLLAIIIKIETNHDHIGMILEII